MQRWKNYGSGVLSAFRAEGRSSRDYDDCSLASQSLVAVVEARGHLRKLEHRGLPPLEAITRRLLKTQEAGRFKFVIVK